MLSILMALQSPGKGIPWRVQDSLTMNSYMNSSKIQSHPHQ